MSSREAILGAIRTNLAVSLPHDQRELAIHGENVSRKRVEPRLETPLIDLFKQSLEAVDGHCVITSGQTGIADALTTIITALQKTKLRAQRIAISEVSLIERVMHMTDLEIEEMSVAPNAADIFNFDVGITTAQAAIAETGTLVLDSADERHRLVSLVPPVHIAIIEASRIVGTLSEALKMLRNGKEISSTVTFITGPSRTADIELTLTIGVHGPQELYVIVTTD